MKVKDLKRMLSKGYLDWPVEAFDEMDVLMPMTDKFDGYFKSPCENESGVAELGLFEHGNETNPAFIIAPHNFFSPPPEISPQLN